MLHCKRAWETTKVKRSEHSQKLREAWIEQGEAVTVFLTGFWRVLIVQWGFRSRFSCSCVLHANFRDNAADCAWVNEGYADTPTAANPNIGLKHRHVLFMHTCASIISQFAIPTSNVSEFPPIGKPCLMCITLFIHLARWFSWWQMTIWANVPELWFLTVVCDTV